MSDVPVFGTRIPGCNYLRRPSVYALLRDLRGRWAVVRTPLGCYLPGGGAEPGESSSQTVEREALEECGFNVKVGVILGRAIQFVYSLEEKQYFEKTCEFMDAELVETGSATELDHETLWVPTSEALSLLTHESHRWAIATLARQPV